MQARVRSLGPEDPLQEETAPHSSILAWRIPWTEGAGGLQSMRCIELHATEHPRTPRPHESSRLLPPLVTCTAAFSPAGGAPSHLGPLPPRHPAASSRAQRALARSRLEAFAPAPGRLSFLHCSEVRGLDTEQRKVNHLPPSWCRILPRPGEPGCGFPKC